MLSEILSLGAPDGPQGLALLLLALFAMSAGFVDAVVGGGGLIQVPALFSIIPNGSAAALFGTNKIASICGTFYATRRYVQEVTLNWRVLTPALVGAAVFSWFGAAAVSFLPRQLAQPLVLVMLVLVAYATLRKRDLGAVHAPRLNFAQQRFFGFATGAVLGFYDGFFGPGTGAFLIFVFVRFFGYDFLHASASSKVINLMTNFAALVFFIPAGELFFVAAVVMAASNIAGAWVGAHLALKKGSEFVRRFFLILLSVLIIKMGLGTLEIL